MSLSHLNELSLYLRPPGQGVFSVSAGKTAIAQFTQDYLGQQPPKQWEDYLSTLLSQNPSVALLGIPSDNGAGMVRGANRGPEGIRRYLQHAPTADLGDIFTVPHFLDDRMLSSEQISQTQRILYPTVTKHDRQHLPVSPIDITCRVYELLKELAPQLKILAIGGDHTVAWPIAKSLLGKTPSNNTHIGILHFDAHTDLSSERLGVPYCFATWAYHANELLGRGERMLQIGIRMTGKPKEHWEQTLGVKQIWAHEALAISPAELGEQVVQHFQKLGIQKIYVSNDIDATDPQWASACGTPEKDGLTPEHILQTLEAIHQSPIEVIGADIVEVAPGLSLSEAASQTTLKTACDYLHAELKLLAPTH